MSVSSLLIAIEYCVYQCCKGLQVAELCTVLREKCLIMPGFRLRAAPAGGPAPDPDAVSPRVPCIPLPFAELT